MRHSLAEIPIPIWSYEVASWRRSPLELYPFDADYLRLLRARDAATEEHFVAYFGKLLLIKLRARGLSSTIVGDITQETFLRVLNTIRSARGIENAGSLGAFVNSVCNNVMLEQHRTASRFEELNDSYAETAASNDDIERKLVTDETRAAVQQVLRELPEKDAQILRALFVDEKSKDDICAEFEISREYLRVRLHRAKELFRRRYPADMLPLPLKRSAVN